MKNDDDEGLTEADLLDLVGFLDEVSSIDGLPPPLAQRTTSLQERVAYALACHPRPLGDPIPRVPPEEGVMVWNLHSTMLEYGEETATLVMARLLALGIPPAEVENASFSLGFVSISNSPRAS